MATTPAPDKPPFGFLCPLCGTTSDVTCSRSRDRGKRITRRRRCSNQHCGARFNTVEISTARLAELMMAAGLAGGSRP